MKNRFLPLLLIACFFLLGDATWAQDPYFINYDVEDGLPSSEVYDIHAAKDGRIFITTDRGVAIYDGYQFTVYSKKDGLASNTNFQIYEDFHHRLWLNGMEIGLSIYEEEQFQPFSGNFSLEQMRMSKWIHELIFSEDGTVYFFNRKEDEGDIYSFVQRDSSTEFLTLKKVTDEFSIIKNEGLTFYQKGVVAFFSEKEWAFWELLKFKNGWVGFQGEDLFHFDQNGQLIQRYNWGQQIDAVFIDHQNNLWLCTLSGLLLFPNSQLNLPPRRYFQDLSITNMCQDIEGNYWLSTLTNGVLFIPSFSINIFKSVSTNLHTEKILTAAPLQHQVAFSTSEGRVFSIDKNAKTKWIKKDRIKAGQFRYANVIDNKIYYRFGYVLTENSISDIQLNSFEDSKAYSTWPSMAGSSSYYVANANFLKELKNGNYIVFNVRGFQAILPDTVVYAPNTFNKRINTIEEDIDSTIWIGTEQGIYRIHNYDYTEIIPAFKDQPNLQGRIQDFIIDQYQNFWVATIGEGLSYQTKNTNYPIKGLNSQHVNTIYASNDSLLWLGTNKGLYRLTYQAGTDSLTITDLERFSNIDGLSSNYINDIASWNNQLWLATNRGVSYFNPDDLEHSYPPTPIKINQLLANNILQKKEEIHSLEHDENDIYIQYTGISYRKDHRSFYRYRLRSNGESPSWFYTNERSVRYNDLRPAEYTFEVMAQNKNQVWSRTPASISFTIHPHFTQTSWFRLLLLFLATFGIMVFWKLQTKRLQQKEHQKHLLQEAEHRTREAELMALRSQMNPHFVFNSLNAIQHYIFKKDVQTANYFLGKFSKLIRDSLEFSKFKYISLEQELAFLNNYLDLEVLRFPNKFSYHFDIEEGVIDQEYLVPSLLLQPVLENSIKYAFRDIDYPGILVVSVKEIPEKDALKITVKDNGLGLPQNDAAQNGNKHKSMGLSIVQNRIDLLQKDKEVIIAAFEITDWKNIDPTKKGVQVDFIIPIKFKSYD